MRDQASGNAKLQEQYLRKAIDEYEYSPAPEYDRTRMSSRALNAGTLDFDYDRPERDVELSREGAWVAARVWVPKEWLNSDSGVKEESEHP